MSDIVLISFGILSFLAVILRWVSMSSSFRVMQKEVIANNDFTRLMRCTVVQSQAEQSSNQQLLQASENLFLCLLPRPVQRLAEGSLHLQAVLLARLRGG